MVITKMTFAVIVCIIFIVSLAYIYFSKQRINNEENKIYKYLIILNIIGLIFHLLCDYVSLNYDSIPKIFSTFILKTYLVYYFAFGILLLTYLIIIANFKKRVVINKVLLIITTIVYLITFFIPQNVHRDLDNMIFYTDGLDVKVIILICGLEIISLFSIIIFRLNRIDKKKAFPLFIFMFGATISIIIQMRFPDIVLTDCIESIIVLLMYFTIENPDVKMINQLELAKEQADKANAAKTDFLSSMSHEIRTPLNAINGFSNLIEEAKTLEEAKANARDIVNASDTLLEIVNGILDISKIEAGKLEIIEAPYNAKETFEELAKLITPRMEEKGLEFTYFVAPDLPSTLYGDHANIKKIITNFLSNACKYTEKGYVKYEVNCINAHDKCKLIVSVEDSGRGIKKENIDKLFTKFDRLDVEKNTTVEGTGLGLAITKQLVELMGGKIIVHTVYGEGSKFTFMVDQKIEKSEIVEELKPNDTIDLHNTKILLVDDNELNLRVGTKMLEKYGCSNITQAHSGFECLDLVKANKYDLILLDDMMPKMSGGETLIELSKIPEFSTPVVALTANAISGMREKYLEQGFDEYLAKPIEKDEFIKVLNKVLSTETSVPNTTEVETTEKVEEKVETPVEEKGETPVEESVVVEEKTEELEPEIDNNTREEMPVDVTEPPEVDNETFLRNHGVDMDKALELLGDMEMYNMTFTDFEKELESRWSKLEQEKLSGDMENYAIDVHALKSDCKYLGFYDLADVAYEHELKSKEKDTEFVNSNFDRLESEYEKVLHIVKEYKEKLL